jgi:putative addiction module component (TIGR02574 family)
MATALPARDIYDAALGLPEADRLDLASRLLESVEGPIDDDWDEAWLAELDRRERAARSGGAAVGSDWSEVRTRVHARLAVR